MQRVVVGAVLGWMAIGAMACVVPVWADEALVLSPEAQAFVAQLDAKDVYERRKAFLQLEALREPAAAPSIRQRLESRDQHTRAFAVRALAAVEGVAAVPTVTQRLREDRNADVRLAAILALEPLQKQDPSIGDTLIGALRDRDREVRMAVADTVSRLDRPDAREAIRKRWKRERDRDVRRVLEEAMKRIGETP